VFPVGRLDQQTEGLLLLTKDGDLANGLTHPRYQIEKEYLAQVGREPTARHLVALRAGVELDDGAAKPKAARIVDARPGKGQLAIVMTEGRKREVRRLLAAVELPVERLVRLRIGPITLGKLRPGEVRPLSPDEVLALQKLVQKAERRLRREGEPGTVA
jgi:23S rRNA pseudouridine2605 synthase